MKSVRKKDFYEVRLMGPFGSAWLSSLTDLYLPLIGSDAFAAYLALREDETAEEDSLILSHDKLFARIDLSAGEFFEAVEKLEGAALVSTFFEEANDQAHFIYCLYPPKLPNAFFEDVLLLGTLRIKIGEESVDRLVKKYSPKEEPTGFSNISASFPSVFRPNYDDPAYRVAPSSSKSGAKELKTDFDYEKFISIVQKNGIAEETLSEKEKKAIVSYGTLYALDPESMFEAFSHSYKARASFGERLDIQKLSKETNQMVRFPYLRKQKKEVSPNSGTNKLAEKIRLMDSVSPSQYLYFLQDGHAPADGDLKIAAMLMDKMGLSAPVANAVIDFVLQTNDNILSKASCEKLAAAVLREGCRTSRDALDFLYGVEKKRRGYKNKANQPAKELPKQEEKPIEEKEAVASEEEEEVTDEMVKQALAEFYNKR